MAASRIDGPRLAHASGAAPETLVILLHGYGADGQDLIGLASQWQGALPTTAFVAPNAPDRHAGSPFGYQWFPITRLDPTEYWRGVQMTAPALNDFIDAELDRHGLDDSKLALVGFSQGTMMSLHVGLRREKQMAAILGYSGALAGPEHLSAEIRSRPPVLLVHGDADDVVPIAALAGASKALGDNTVAHRTHVSRGVGHGIAPDGLALGGSFLKDAFSGGLKFEV